MKKVIISLILIFVIYVSVNMIPAISLYEFGMKKSIGESTIIYFHQRGVDFVGRDFITEYDAAVSEVLCILGLDLEEKIKVYIYDNYYDILDNKYGIYSNDIYSKGYITETHKGENVLLTEPTKSNQIYNQVDELRSVTEGLLKSLRTTQEYKSSDFFICGLANYIAYHKLDLKIIDNDVDFPNYDKRYYSDVTYDIFEEDLESKEQHVVISSYYYVKYLEEQFGEETLIKLLKDEDYESLIGKSHVDIYEDWRNDMRK